jgi:hypothetical protein
MGERKTWVIIDLRTGKSIYGINNVTMRFTTSEVAHEIAFWLFETREDYLITQIF